MTAPSARQPGFLSRLVGRGAGAARDAGAAPGAVAPLRLAAAAARERTEADEDRLEDIATEIVSIFEYQGFDQVRMRRFIIEHFSPAEVVTALSVYAQVGNGLLRRVQRGKLADTATAAEIMRDVNNMGIVTKALKSQDVTLPRMAMCFPRVVTLIRLKNASVLPPRFATSTPQHLQDLCLNAWADSAAAVGCDDFIKKLSFELARAKDPAAKQVDSDDRVMQFRELGRAALTRDDVGRRAMSTAVDASETLGGVLREYGFVLDRPVAPAAGAPSGGV